MFEMQSMEAYFKFQFIGQLEKRVIAREQRDRGNLLR